MQSPRPRTRELSFVRKGVGTEQPNDRPQVFHRQPGQEMAVGTDEEIRVAKSTRLLVFETTPRKYCVSRGTGDPRLSRIAPFLPSLLT